MNRPRLALVALTLAAVSVTGCTGRQKDATESSVRDDVRDQLLESGYVSAPGEDPIEVTDEGVATDIGSCVARTMFEETDEFTKDERNAATSVSDGDEPDPDLVLKVEALVNDCYAQVVDGEDAADEEQTSGDEEGSDPSEETTTTEG
jgi:hypothetical protein